MAVASLIGSAIGILLLIITAYVLVGGSIGTTETMVRAQTDMTAIHQQQLATSISIDEASGGGAIWLVLTNRGGESIRDLNHLDVYVKGSSGETLLYTGPNVTGSDGQWSKNFTSSILNPGESVNLTVPYSGSGTITVRAITPNGAAAAAVVGP
jgi:flagellar protein FlaF